MRKTGFLYAGRNLKPVAEKILYSPGFLYILVAFGVLARLAQYLANRSLWFDELMLALNIINRSYPELLQPLDYVQAAPAAFLLANKYLCTLWGDGEMVLRLIPLVSGLLALALFYPLARILARPRAALIALSLFAFSRYAIYYSAEVKQYSTDLAFTVLILLLSSHVYNGGYRVKNYLTLGLVGAAAVWCSHAVIFVLAGAGAALLIETWLERDRLGSRPLVQTVLTGILWIGSFLSNYCLITRFTVHPNFYPFWKTAFLPFPPHSFSDLIWLPSNALNLINKPLGMVTPGIVILTFVAGTLYLWRSQKRFHLLLLNLPILTLVIASALKFYPLSDRLVLFILPLCYIPIAEGSYQILACLNRNRIVGLVFLFLLLLYPVGGGLTRMIRPQLVQESRPVIARLLENRKEDEPIFMNFAAQHAFNYYTREEPVEYQIWEVPVGTSIYNKQCFFEMEEAFLEQDRAWFFFCYLPGEEAYEYIFLSYLDAKGDQVDAFRAEGASIYLYDFRDRDGGQ